MWCKDCKAIFEQPLAFAQQEWRLDWWWAKTEYNITLSDLEQKATGCHGCHSLLRKLRANCRNNGHYLQPTIGLQVVYDLTIQAPEQGAKRLTVSAFADGKELGILALHFQEALSGGE